jgi:hypothetical protein
MLRICLATITAWILVIMLAMLLLALLEPAHAGERYPGEGRQGRSWSEPHYTPSWERTQRRYLPSYQYELERRRYCGNMCDDVRERRGPFDER